MLWVRRCEEDVIKRRCEKDIPSTDSNLISFVFQLSNDSKVAEDLISFTDLLVIPVIYIPVNVNNIVLLYLINIF